MLLPTIKGIIKKQHELRESDVKEKADRRGLKDDAAKKKSESV